MGNRLRSYHAFTIVELLLVMVMVSVLVGLLVPAMAQARAKSRRITCVCNLKQIGLGCRVFASDQAEQLDTPTWRTRLATSGKQPTPADYYRAMSNELATPLVLACPADTRRPAADWASFSPTNVSYFVGLEARESFPQLLLAGDRNLSVNGVPVAPGLLALSTNTFLGWTESMHRRLGNVVLGDGSVQQVTGSRLRWTVGQFGAKTNWLVVP